MQTEYLDYYTTFSTTESLVHVVRPHKEGYHAKTRMRDSGKGFLEPKETAP